MNAARFDKVMLKTKTVSAKATAAGIKVGFEGEKAPAEAAGLRPRAGRGGPQPERQGDRGATTPASPSPIAASSTSTSRCARTCRTSSRSATSSGQPMLAHKAVHEAHVAAEAAAGREVRIFDARQIPSVAYTDPEVAWAGLTEDSARRRASSTARRCSRGPHRAARSPTAATRASPSCSSTRRRIAASAAASSARMRAT